MSRLRTTHPRRGATLVEALVAIAVLGVGTAAVTDLVTSIANSRRRLTFQSTALELFNRFNSEIQASTCVVFPAAPGPDATSADAVFLVPPNTWIGAPPLSPPLVGSAHVTAVGDFNTITPRVRVEFQVAPNLPNLALANDTYSYDITVRIRELTGDAAVDNANVASGYNIKTWPIHKVCMWRATADTRGGFP